MRPVVLLVLLASCQVVFGLPEVPTPTWYGTYRHRKAITVLPVASLSIGTYTLPIVIAADADLAASAEHDGRDLVITAEDGVTPLPYEIESYDSATGALVAWVQIGRFYGTGTVTKLDLYYGGDLVSVDATRAWNADYGGVWHFTGTATTAPDSTRNANTLQQLMPALQPARVAGVLGPGVRFDGVDDLLRATASASIEAGTLDFTYSAWVDATPTGESDMPLFKGGFDTGAPGYDLELGYNAWETDIADDGTQHLVTPFGSATELAGGWHQLVVVIDRGAGQLVTYLDGRMHAMQPIAGLGSLSSPMQDLVLSRPGFPYRGALDEVRLFHDIEAPGRVLTEYEHIAHNAQYVTIGDEESR